jgi:hypothetical protein
MPRISTVRNGPLESASKGAAAADSSFLTIEVVAI